MRHTSPTGAPSSACFKMNAFCASENFDAFIAFRSSRPGKCSAENSNAQWPSLAGSDQALERDDGKIAAIEVKASATVRSGDFRGLRALAEACGDRFAYGVVLYDGKDVVPFGDGLAAASVSCLWR
ncbi:MAG: hypothetical protein MI723_02925 [Caulobacterales bacterium]|nr:hypothetical protein [Caulobacterales bacterium]